MYYSFIMNEHSMSSFDVAHSVFMLCINVLKRRKSVSKALFSSKLCKVLKA